jgi:hypothetical protein
MCAKRQATAVFDVRDRASAPAERSDYGALGEAAYIGPTPSTGRGSLVCTLLSGTK